MQWIKGEAAMVAKYGLQSSVETATDACESEIEKIICAGWFMRSAWFSHTESCWSDRFSQRIIIRGEWSNPGFQLEDGNSEIFTLHIQPKVGEYRPDFIFSKKVRFGPLDRSIYTSTPTIVECDGHDFHEKTKDQARRDKKRDRKLQSSGFRILRFTGSEIWASPNSCLEEIDKCLNDDVFNQCHTADCDRLFAADVAAPVTVE